MRFLVGAGVVLAVALIAGAGWMLNPGTARADGPAVTIMDNGAPLPNQGIDAKQSEWGYGPAQIVVTKGDQVVFTNGAGSKYPHTVTSIARNDGSTAFDGSLAAGSKFDSSPSRDAFVTPGNSWTLDTSTLDPGNYAYYCRIHPWMVGEITVLPSQ